MTEVRQDSLQSGSLVQAGASDSADVGPVLARFLKVFDRTAVRYAVAMLAACLAVLLQVLLDLKLTGHIPFVISFAAVALAAWCGGVLAGLLCAVAAYFGLSLLVIDSHGALLPDSPQQWIAAAMYLASAVIVATSAGAARSFMYRLANANRLLQEKQAWLTWQVTQLNDNQREREGLLAREQAARGEAQEANERLQGMLESIGDAFFALDRAWRYTYINNRAERYYGQPKEAMLGRSIWDVLPQAVGAKGWEQLHEVMRTGEAAHCEFVSPVSKRWLDLHVYPSPNGLSVFFEDIHEAKITQAALRETQARFEAFMHNSPARAWIKDAQLRYVFVNDALRNAVGEPMLGRSDDELFDTATACAARERDRAVLDSGAPRQSVEAVNERGVTHHVLIVRFVIDGVEGQRYLAGKGIDISEQIWAQNALRDADRRKDEFLATLAHELRNPLNPVRSAAAFLRMSAPADPKQRQAVEVIERQIARMAHLLDDLLDVSRMTLNKLQLRRACVAVNDLVERAVETSRPLMHEARHELSVQLPQQPVFVNGDAARLEQVLSNLLNNAAKYTAPGGRIALTVGVDGEWVSIGVRDTGIGIDAAQLGKVFEMFSQLGDADGHSQGGLGIGLALVRALVQLHGGTIHAHSEGVGKGSVFTVRLPWVASPVAAIACAAEADGSPRARKRRVLVVDDNADAVESWTLLLQHEGHEVCCARDGGSALEAAGSFHPDVALLDIGLPGISGYDVARWIRRQPWGAQVLLIAVTGWGQPEDKRRTAAAGFDHHLTKPVSPEMVNRLLAGEDGSSGSQAQARLEE